MNFGVTQLPRQMLTSFDNRISPVTSMVGLLVARCLVFATIAVDVTSESRFSQIAEKAESVWEPISVLGILRSPAPASWVIGLLMAVAVVGSVSTLLGLCSRLAAAFAATAYTFLVLALNSFGKIDHDRNVLIIAVWILVFAPAVDLRGRPQPASTSYGWPVQMIRLSIGLMFLAAAWAKVRLGQGGEWVFGPNIRNVLASEVLIYETPDLRTPPLSSTALWIADRPWAWKTAALGALAGEFSLIFAVFSTRVFIRRAATILGLGTMCGITLLMGMVSFPILALAAIFVTVGDPTEGRLSRLTTLALIYGVLGAVMVVQKSSMWPVVPLVVAWLSILRFAKISSPPKTV